MCQTKQSIRTDPWMAGALAAVMFTGLGIRSLVSFFPPLAVGDDGAYYLVQVRGLLQEGSLPIPDFPFLFYLQAGLAHIFSFIMEQRPAIVAAVRITDTLLPLMLALPVLLYARSFLRTGDHPFRGVMAIVMVGLIAVASGNTLLMAGGMIKNGVALPFSFLFTFSTYEWFRDGQQKSLFWAAFWFLLAALTHMSGIILSAAFAICILVAALVTPSVRRRVWIPVIVLLSCLAGCLAVLNTLDPVRAQRLFHAVVNPAWMFAGAPWMLWMQGYRDEAYRLLSETPEMWPGILLGILGIFTLFRFRVGMDPPERVLLIATTLVTLAFSLPLFRPDVNQRLAFIAFVPGMIPAVYLLCRKAFASAFIVPFTLVMILWGALEVKTLSKTVLIPDAYQDLESFRTLLPPGRTIVISRPMLRWWVAWTMETHFSTTVAQALAARQKYDAVLVLDEIRSGAFGLAPVLYGLGRPGTGVRDANLLEPLEIQTLKEGTWFRLSEVTAAH